MPTQPPNSVAPQVVAYDREGAYRILREWTGRRLAAELRAGRFGARLSAGEAAELEELLTAWAQRALGEMPLRDALLADEARGRRVFALVCAALTVARAPAPPGLAPGPLPAAGRADLQLGELGARAARDGLALAVQDDSADYPYPDDLEALRPPLPAPPAAEPFQQPTGWRRSLAALLAGAGVLLLAAPMLAGHIPDHPAGLPLAMLTMALMVGIRARSAGYAGAICIWLVANLPGFRHGTGLHALWPALPLLAAGLALLSLDPQVQAMWRWLRRRRGR
jgi:hypothetical protein